LPPFAVAKAKAPSWLREAFSRGVDAYTAAEHPIGHVGLYEGANRFCWLAQHDPAKRPCTPGRLERFHFIRRQDVEAAMFTQLWHATIAIERPDGVWLDAQMTGPEREDLTLIAAWDPRNGGLACEQHHRRYDQHQVSLPRERVIVRYEALPSTVVQFGFDYSEGRLLDRFPSEI
jgi:hypothetical protein